MSPYDVASVWHDNNLFPTVLLYVKVCHICDLPPILKLYVKWTRICRFVKFFM